VSGGNRPHQSHEWADETTERLRAMWLAGATTRVIGAELGVSRNAVVGKARRLDLPPRPNPKGVRRGGELPPPRPRPQPSPPRPRLEPQQKCAMGRRPPAPPPPAPPQPPAAPPSDVRQCMYPISDGRPWRFCGAPCVPNRVYCAEHVALCYHQPGRYRMEAAA
jgi:GcrA cell cycle regulator